MSYQITLKGKDAINVNNIAGGGKVVSIELEAGTYAVNLESDVNFHDQTLPIDQIIIFNTAPLNTGDAEAWYFVVNEKQGIQIKAEASKKIYVVLLDQVTSVDNTGSATVTFSRIV